MLGGTLTAASVNYPAMFFAWGKQISSGPCWEAVEQCDKLGGAVIPDKDVDYIELCGKLKIIGAIVPDNKE